MLATGHVSDLELCNRLKVIPLSYKGIKIATNNGKNESLVKIMFCGCCYNSLTRKSNGKVLGPPKLSIANNWASGDLPESLSIRMRKLEWLQVHRHHLLLRTLEEMTKS